MRHNPAMSGSRLLISIACLSISGGGCIVLFQDPDDGTGGSTSSGATVTIASSPSGSGSEADSGSTAVVSATVSSGSGGAGACEAAGGQCVEAPGVGWSGPVVLARPGGCPGGSRVALTVANDAAAPARSCRCKPDGPVCNPPAVTLYSTDDCSGNSHLPAVFNEGVCVAQPDTFIVESLRIDTIPSTVVQPCVHDVTDPTPSPLYDSPFDLCEMSDGCEAGSSCAPAGRACVFAMGSQSCASPYEIESDLVTAAEPTCMCAGVSPESNCTGQLQLGAVGDCGTSTIATGTIGCHGFGVDPGGLGLDYVPMMAGSCGDSTWGLAIDPVTLCCKPE